MSDEQRRWLIEHLLADDKHRVMSYGPTSHPADLDTLALTAWHKADHKDEEGVGPRDGHIHIRT